MSPATHLFASWLIAAKTTDNPRDRRLVALSGILPDLDGGGLLIDLAKQALHGGDKFLFYQKYHHYVLHGIFGAMLIAITLMLFARKKWRVGVLSFLLVHLHMLFDLIGSRGPGLEDIWPIYYLAPFNNDWMWMWKHQWALDAWPNRVFSVLLFALCIKFAVAQGDSFVGVFNRRADQIFVFVLRDWRDKLKGRRTTGTR